MRVVYEINGIQNEQVNDREGQEMEITKGEELVRIKSWSCMALDRMVLAGGVVFADETEVSNFLKMEVEKHDRDRLSTRS
jgi:hypothetical protein